MGFWRNLASDGIGILGKSLMGAANAATGGLAGTAVDSVVSGAHKHSGLIGKIAKGIGEKYLSEGARKSFASMADKAINFMPAGKMKDALSKINDSAQGRTSSTTAKLSSVTNPVKQNTPIVPTRARTTNSTSNTTYDD